MSTNTLALNRVTTTGWRMGLRNMLAKEFGAWFRTRTWLVQSLIWTAVADLLLLVFLFEPRVVAEAGSRETAGMLFVLFAGMGVAVGTCIVMQDAIVGEKQMGTAAWVLSKPVSRLSYVLSKLVANSFGLLVAGVFIPGIVAYILFAGSQGGAFPVSNFLLALGAVWVNMMFYLTLSLMLGSIFSARGPVIGIPLMLLMLYQLLLGLVPKLYYVGPWSLVVPLAEPGKPGAGEQSLGAALLLGQPLPTLVPLFMVSCLSIIFVIVALWRFQREEF